jgi:SAM-dependent methyltransferase
MRYDNVTNPAAEGKTTLSISPKTSPIARFFRRYGLPGLALVCCGFVAAQEAVAPYVTTTREDVQRMLDLADLLPGDVLLDLGSGDGRIPIAAAERGALGFGVEIEAELVARARERAAQAGVADRTHFLQGSVFTTPIAHASIVTMYLMPEVNMQLRERLLRELQPGTRIVSNTFTLGDWSADRHIPGRTSGGLLLWVVPANFAGPWRSEKEQGFGLSLLQQFQRLEGRMEWQGEQWTLRDARVRGERASWLQQSDSGRNLAVSARLDGEVLTLEFLHLSEAEDSLQIGIAGERLRALRERRPQELPVP